MPRKTSSPRRKSPKASSYEAELKRDIAAEGRKIGELASKVYTKNSTQGIPFAGSKTAAALAQAFEEPVAYSATDLQEELENDTGDCINKLSMYAVEPDLFNLARPGDYQTDKVKNGDFLHLDERAAVMGSVGASQVLCDILHGVRSKTITLQDGLDKKLIYVEDLIEHIHDRYGSVITLEKDTTSVLDRVSRDQRVNLERHLLKQLFEDVCPNTGTIGGDLFLAENHFFFDKFKNMVLVKEKSVGKTWKTADRSDATLKNAYRGLRLAVKTFLEGSPRVMFSSNMKTMRTQTHPLGGAAGKVTTTVAFAKKTYEDGSGVIYDVTELYDADDNVEAFGPGNPATRNVQITDNNYPREMVSHILTIVAAHVLTYANTAAIDFLVQLGQKASDGKVDFAKGMADEIKEFNDQVNGSGAWATAIADRGKYVRPFRVKAGGAKEGPIEYSIRHAFEYVDAQIAEQIRVNGLGGADNVYGGKNNKIAADTKNGVLDFVDALAIPDGVSAHAISRVRAVLNAGGGANVAAMYAKLASGGTYELTINEAMLKDEASHVVSVYFTVPHTVFAPGLLAALELYKVSESRFDDEMALQLNTNKDVKALFVAAHKSYDMDDESSGAKSYVRATDTTPAWLMSAEDKLKYEQQFEKIKEYSGKRADTAAVAAVRTSNSAENLAKAFTDYRDMEGVAKRLHTITTGFGRRRKRRSHAFGRRRRSSKKSKKASFGRRRRSSKKSKSKKASFGRKKKTSHRRR